jgi:hypothetical protein
MSKSKMEKILTNYVPPTKKITFGRRKSLKIFAEMDGIPLV